MKKSRFTDRTKWKIIIVLMVGMVVVALFLQAGILMYVNSKNLDKTSQMLLDQSISIIEKNQKNEIDLIRSMKEDYVIRARAVSYILESRLEAENDTEELQKIASLMSIDEIYLFDATGKIYSGTKQEYYGYSFDSGEQMEYFKPMLENKGLTMCQDITPNTSEGRSMMYAITWNSTGDKMIQVGIEPVRLLAEIKQNDVSTVVSNMPMYQGMNLYVADLDTHEILGATDENTIGKKLEAKHKEAIVWDVEKGVPSECQDKAWQTCSCLGTWHYNRSAYEDNWYKSAETVIHMLIDIVSKNGNLLLSVPMKGNGTIDDKEEKILEDIAAWMEVNGEGIFDTRPWCIYGEGPSTETAIPLDGAGFNEGKNAPYTSADIRFVKKGKYLYAHIMKWPSDGKIQIKSLAIGSPYCKGEIEKVELLGGGKAKFRRTSKGLLIDLPKDKTPNPISLVLKITNR